MMKHYVRLACFVGGALFGSAGVKLLTSKDAKKAYTHITAAGLRMKDSVMETVTTVQEKRRRHPGLAKDINEARAAQEARVSGRGPGGLRDCLKRPGAFSGKRMQSAARKILPAFWRGGARGGRQPALAWDRMP